MTREAVSWRAPHNRLMALSRRGKAVRVASGSVGYLLQIARKGVVPGRKWIELNTAPASVLTLKKPHRSESHT